MDDELDFASMPPQLRAVALVGQFLQYWALLESQINRAIGKSLSLGLLQEVILVRNMQLRDKIHFLRTMVDSTPVDQDRYQKVLRKVADIVWERNTVAHELFFDHDPEGDGVKFYVEKAKGKLSFPPTIWSIEEFEQKFKVIRELTQDMAALANAMTPDIIAVFTRKNALMPNAMMTARGGLSDLDPPP